MIGRFENPQICDDKSYRKSDCTYYKYRLCVVNQFIHIIFHISYLNSYNTVIGIKS